MTLLNINRIHKRSVRGALLMK